MQGDTEKEPQQSGCWSNFMNGVRVAWPPLLVVLVIGFTYSTFLAYTLLPQFDLATRKTPITSDPNDPNDYVPSYGEIVGVIISFHVFFLMLILCFVRSSITSPGFIPNSEMWREGAFGISDSDERRLINLLQDHKVEESEIVKEQPFLKTLPVIERKMGGGTGKKAWERRFCSKCSRYKPDRAHHCRICKQCVLRMDHHCPWIANCVGYENYKFFLLFLLYGSICSAFVMGVMLRRLIRSFRPVLDTNYFISHDLVVILAYLLASFLFVALFVFFCWHMGLVFNCLTTIELREKQNSDHGKVRHQWLVAHQKYDMGGKYANLVHIFGSPWMWLLPLKSDIAGRDGTYATLASVTVV